MAHIFPCHYVRASLLSVVVRDPFAWVQIRISSFTFVVGVSAEKSISYDTDIMRTSVSCCSIHAADPAIYISEVAPEGSIPTSVLDHSFTTSLVHYSRIYF